MAISIGIDIGSLSIKTSCVVDGSSYDLAKSIVANKKEYTWTDYSLNNEKKVFILKQYKVEGKPRVHVENIIKKIKDDFKDEIKGITITGAGGKFAAKVLGLNYITEFKAIAESFKSLFPDIKSVFEIGGENSKYLGLEKGLITDYEANGSCAAGTGSFLDQQASRLKYQVEEVGEVALNTQKTAIIAGRCSVFAKSDMIHAQQKGYSPSEILKGLCRSIALNYKSNLLKGKDISVPVAFVGGVALNKAVSETIKDMFEISDKDFIVPKYPSYIISFGASIYEALNDTCSNDIRKDINIEEKFPVFSSLSTEKVVFLNRETTTYNFPKEKVEAFLGIDVGSVSTNLVVVDNLGNVIKEVYLMTVGRPIDVVSDGLNEIKNEIGNKIIIKGVATTGSGRELIGELIGADLIKDEITAHKTGASFISKKYFNEDVDTIFEIGGQDSKYINLNKGVVVDFHMNEACSAGTGSFLQEQAEKLGVNIKNEFSKLALSSKNPINLGERCTVFIEKDLNNYQQKGANLKDLIAGLSYSVVHNYLNRVVRGRDIGNIIYFQGGTAYNDSVAAAFSKVLNKRIVVPPHNGVMGAIGAALISKENYEALGVETNFRGYDIKSINYSIREFTCNGCSNQCDIQEFSVEGNKTYWGDKCSEKFRKALKTGIKPVIKDVFKERENLLFDSFNRYHLNEENNKKTIGFPRSMYFYDRFPFWSTLFGELGFKMLLSEPTNKKIINDGSEIVVADPCFPIKVAHGHVKNLIEKDVDYILSPYMINSECLYQKEETERQKAVGRKQTYFCLWGQTLPHVLMGNKHFINYKNKFITPKVEYREGDNFVINDIYNSIKDKFSWINIADVKKAYLKAKNDLETFRTKLYDLYQDTLNEVKENNRECIVLIGRPYNVNDKGLNLNLASKLRDLYGVNVIPIDMIGLENYDVEDINDNMFWGYGRRILATLKQIRNSDNMHVIYITNFQCGPDSYIKHFTPTALGKSYLTLQFDGHGNDAGMMTRCEAYLDSKNVFKFKKEQVLEVKQENNKFNKKIQTEIRM
jgi:predicted CoA-substrate-specific enzyme activase